MFYCARYEVLIVDYWAIMLCHWVNSSWFDESLCLHLHSQAVNDQTGFDCLNWRWRQYDPSKDQELFIQRHIVTFQKDGIFTFDCICNWCFKFH
jgi:hypothetical protein